MTGQTGCNEIGRVGVFTLGEFSRLLVVVFSPLNCSQVVGAEFRTDFGGFGD